VGKSTGSKWPIYKLNSLAMILLQEHLRVLDYFNQSNQLRLKILAIDMQEASPQSSMAKRCSKAFETT